MKGRPKEVKKEIRQKQSGSLRARSGRDGRVGGHVCVALVDGEGWVEDMGSGSDARKGRGGDDGDER